MTNNENTKNTVIHEERQYSKKEIIDDIIKILVDHNLSVSEAREILKFTSRKLGEQKITISV